MELIKLEMFLIVFSPLLAASILFLFKHRLTYSKINAISLFFVFLSTFFAVKLFLGFLYKKLLSVNGTFYICGEIGRIKLQLGFLLDSLSSLMLMVVAVVTLAVTIYSMFYMKNDKGYNRFFCYILLFMFSMFMLVIANNFFQLFFGWEAVGLISYLLIGFWFKKDRATFAGLKALLINRIGDFAFILGIAAIFMHFETLDYQDVFQNVASFKFIEQKIIIFNNYECSAVNLICVLLFIGAMAKSAQVPLHVWLPDSMEGPTPISALIHAATMVTAGVFLLARLSPLFEHSMITLNFILIIGAITCLLGGLLAIVQNNIKKIIAYSTISQLGYMVMAAATSFYSFAIFHLLTHAFIKALLFLSAGSVIIAMDHEENIIKMGNLKKYLPITYIVILVAILSLIGFPGFSCFFSKELIIKSLSNSNLVFAKIAYYIALSGIFITALYSFRLLFICFHQKERFKIDPLKKDKLLGDAFCGYSNDNFNFSTLFKIISFILLIFPGLFIGGWLFKNILINFFDDSILNLNSQNVLDNFKNNYESTFKFFIKGFYSKEFFFGLFGAFVAWILYVKYVNLPNKIVEIIKPVYQMLRKKLWFDVFNEKIIVPFILGISFVFYRIFEKIFLEKFMVSGISYGILKNSKILKKIQTGYLYHYVFYMLIGFFILFIFMFF